jgi:hypothetical protein
VVLALIAIPINTYWIMQMELVRYSGHPTTISIFFNAIFTLLVITVANLGVKRVSPKRALRQGELLTIYLMVSVASALCGHDFLEILCSYIGHSYRFATPENHWASLFHGMGPDALAMHDKAALEDVYVGGANLYRRSALLAWATPVLIWTGFITAMVTMMMATNVLLRKRWIESERLTYPLVQLPLEMTDERMALYRNRLLWIGVAIAGTIDLTNGLNYLFPSVPMIPVRVQVLEGVFNQRPWNAWGGFTISFYPFVLGLGMLLPVDLLFSSWFFYFFWKAQRVLSAAMAWDTVPNFPYVNEQSFAGYIGIAAFALWTGRHYFRDVGKRIFGLPSPVSDEDEPWSYRLAFVVLCAGSLAILGFCLWAGMSLWVAFVFFLIYALLSLAITRIRAELGPPAHDLHNGGPDIFLVDAAGTQNLGGKNLLMFSWFFFFNRAYRAHPMPFQLEGLKMAERAKMNSRYLTLAMLLAAAFGCLASFWAFLHLGYQLGIGTAKVTGPVVWAFGPEPWNRLQSWMESPLKPNGPALTAMAGGFLFTILLMAMRMRFYWWPFHPVGYAVSSSWSLQQIWLPITLAWVIKLLILRYGGLRLYRHALPLFLGLILGEFIVGSLWTIIGIVFNMPSYGFWV